MLAGAIGGLGALVASLLGRASPARAAAGDPLRIGQSNFAGTSATRLFATSSGGAFWMTQNGSGSGVRGESLNGTAGVFETRSPNRFGLLATNVGGSPGSGAAIRADGGQSWGIVAEGALGIQGVGNQSNLSGVHGFNAMGGAGVSGASDGTAIWGFSSAITGAGVLGEVTSTASNSAPIGVAGVCSGTGDELNEFISVGVYGANDNESANSLAAGTWGDAASPQAAGVVARNFATTGNAVGILASSASPTGFAGQFNGNVDINGTLTKAAGAFKIDHPLDPENKVLLHSFVESPEMMNVYSGTTTTNADGLAEVTLPDWFEALNRDVRYQLTPIGSLTLAAVNSEVADNRFVIRTNEPRVKVSWQVTGVRRDAYAEAHPVPVEQPKAEADRGRYLHPLEHGKPREAGIRHLTSARPMERPQRRPAAMAGIPPR
ncbi:MAG: hypothetical protein ACRDJN_27400 [Chloroflexota bacterium]